MSISHEQHLKLKEFLTNKVEQSIIDGLQEWQSAANQALALASDPADSDSILYWVAVLVGNMLWAATVFFPPSSVVAGLVEATTATKVATVLGAAGASDAASKVLKRSSTTSDAKEFLAHMLGQKHDELKKVYLAAAPGWIAEDLAPHVTDELRKAAHLTPETGSQLTDQDAENFLLSVAAVAGVRDYTYENLLFPGAVITAGALDETLQVYMSMELNRALAAFNQQYSDWEDERSGYIARGYSEPRLREMLFGNLGVRDGKVVIRKSQVEMLEDDFDHNHPFVPNVRFHGIPPHLHGPYFQSAPPAVRIMMANFMTAFGAGDDN
jgi:hypothetical protein